MIKEEKLKDLMNRISLALKDAALQQGFEIICKKLAELEKENEELQEFAENIVKASADNPNEFFELKKKNEELKEQLTILEKRINTLKIKNASLERKNEEQKAQIEKMKCCGNCKHHHKNETIRVGNNVLCRNGKNQTLKEPCLEWELPE